MINAPPKDPEDINVQRPPPNLGGPESEHAKMQVVDESDHMTLRPVKRKADGTAAVTPLNAGPDGGSSVIASVCVGKGL